MQDILKPAAALFIITLVCAVGLAVIYDMTKEPIERAEVMAREESMNSLIPDTAEFREIQLSGENELVTQVFEAVTAQGEIAGYCIFTQAQGYAGSVGVLTALDENGIILGVRVVQSSETPGLGTLAGEPKFLRQFESGAGGFSVTKNAAAGTGEIAAVTSATITSNAVTNAVNAATEYFALLFTQ